jgi:hypothetical protein
VLNVSKGGAPMIDPLSKVERELKAAEGFFELAKNASSLLCRRTIAASLSGTFRPKAN